MGIFARLFSQQSQTEFSSAVERDWYDTLMAAGMPSKEAYENLMEEREIARKEADLKTPFGKPEYYWSPQDDNPAGCYGAAWPPGTFAAPPQYGQVLLAKEATDPLVAAYLQKVRLEGVRDADIIWFWDMRSVERIMMMHLFTLNVGALWVSVAQQGAAPAQAGLTARKVHPCFGDPDDAPGPPNSPIPVELKNRINVYSGQRRRTDAQRFHAEIEAATTFNALIRREIKAGNL